MRVGLIGFGRTGRSVAACALGDPTVQLEWVVRRSLGSGRGTASEALGMPSSDPAVLRTCCDMSAAELLDRHPVDAIIDFSSESGIDFYGDAAAQRGISVVCAISRFATDRMPDFTAWATTTRVLWSPNITVGVNFMLLAARTLRAIAPCADVDVLEEHFKTKADVSGTAVRLCEELELDPALVKAVRTGGIVGNHEVIFGFPQETFRLRHESVSREAFGNGALFAAHHLLGRPNGFYRMEDLLMPYFACAGELRELATADDIETV